MAQTTGTAWWLRKVSAHTTSIHFYTTLISGAHGRICEDGTLPEFERTAAAVACKCNVQKRHVPSHLTWRARCAGARHSSPVRVAGFAHRNWCVLLE
jgi:hypothetical protein